MNYTVIALFHSSADAEGALGDIERRGISRDRISIITKRCDTPNTTLAREGNSGMDDVIGVRGGALVGGVTGLFVGMGALLIPGIGAVLAVGPLAASLVTGIGVASGAVMAPIIDALMDTGVTRTNAERFEEGVRRGGTLLSVEVEEELVDEVEDILERSGAVDIHERTHPRAMKPPEVRGAVSNPDRNFDFDENGSDDIDEAIAKNDRSEARRDDGDVGAKPFVRRISKGTSSRTDSDNRVKDRAEFGRKDVNGGSL